MKILVFSDSHCALRHMRSFLDGVNPDHVIHLGDHYDDFSCLMEEYAGRFSHCQVPGNCDWNSAPYGVPEILIQRVCGVSLYMTHGHRHRVKQYLGALLQDARASRVQAVLYGHTHVADCHQEEDGLWVMNPGSCAYSSGTAGLIETQGNKITSCRILRQEDLEDRL